MPTITVAQAIALFEHAEPVLNNERLLRDLRTALRYYVLPHYGYPTEKLNSLQKLNGALSTIPLTDFTCAGMYFEETATDLIRRGEEKRTLDRYQSALHSFMRWLWTQEWYQQAAETKEEQFAWCSTSRTNIETSRAGKKPLRGKSYALKNAELSEELQTELQELTKFWTKKIHAKRKGSRLRKPTMDSRLVSILSFLGWLHHSRNMAIEQLNLGLIANLNLLGEFVEWGTDERDNSYAWAANIGKASLTVAKWYYGQPSKRRAYKDIPAIEEIRDKVSEWASESRTEPKQTVSEMAMREKLVTIEELSSVCRYLRRRCAPKRTNYTKRSDYAIMQSWQRYLIILILTYCPIRQREIRELEIGRTLHRERNCYKVVLDANGHKNGSRTGKGRRFPLPEHLTADLDEWLRVWRPKVKLNHQYVFFSVDHSKPHSFGQPFTAQTIYRMVKTTMFSSTGYLFGNAKRTTPHDFRRIAITWQRKYGVAEDQAGLAEIMGHSVKYADQIYDQMAAEEKAEAASEWWKHKRPSLQLLERQAS